MSYATTVIRFRGPTGPLQDPMAGIFYAIDGTYPVLTEDKYYQGTTGSLLPGLPRERLYLVSCYRD